MAKLKSHAAAMLLLTTLGLGGCAAGTTPTTGMAAAGDLSLRLSGRGGWSIDCTAVTARGREARADARGVASDPSQKIFLQDVVSAECTWAAGDAPLTVTLAEEGIACPFGDFEDGVCQTAYAAGASGTFTFKPA